MTLRIGIVTTVHHPDDPRLHHKLATTLTRCCDVTLAARGPLPVDGPPGVAHVELPGGRLRRNLAAARLVLGRRFDVTVLPDPELLPVGIVAALSRRHVVFDLHEDVPAQLAHKPWLWRPLRRPAAWLAGLLLRLAERVMAFTLAEDGYHRLLRHRHPVFVNYPREGTLPEPRPGDRSVVYVGDVTEQRGVGDVLAACGALADPPRLIVIGRVDDDLAVALRRTAAGLGVDLELTGRLPYREAWERAAGCGIGVSPIRDLPNYRHSLPTKVIEYLAVGLPAVVADLPGTRAVVEGLTGVTLVPPGDTEAWTEAIGRALGDRRPREQTARASDEIRQRHRWPEEEVLAFYDGLAAKQR